MRLLIITTTIFLSQLLLANDTIKIVGYLPTYRWELLNELDYSHMTHLCAAFANPDEDGNMIFDKDLEQFTKVCHKNGTIALVSICGGGDYSWGEKYKVYESLIASPTSRTAFVHKIMDFVRESGVDGLDNDMEGKALELPNYNVFSQELADSLHAQKLLYTAALGVNGQWGAGNLSDLTLSKMDFVMTMSYGGVGHWNWEQKPNEATVEKMCSDLKYFTDRQYAASNVIGGVPFYYTEFPNTAQQNYGVFNKTNCELYSDINYLAKLKKGEDTLYTTNGNVVYINTPKMYEQKLDIARENNSGIMIWEVGQDCLDGNYSVMNHMGKYLDAHQVKLDAKLLGRLVRLESSKKKKLLVYPFKIKSASYVSNGKTIEIDSFAKAGMAIDVTSFKKGNYKLTLITKGNKVIEADIQL